MMVFAAERQSWAPQLILNLRFANRVFTMPLAFMHFFRLISAVLALLLAQAAWAVTPFTV